MNKLNIDFENCYGIKKLVYTFDFTAKRTYSIYAPNGVMKTSFAKAFLDFSNSADSQDSIFTERKTKRVITDETGQSIPNDQVCVIVPYDKSYKSKKISTLLVNKILRERYEQIHLNIDEKKEALLKELRSFSGLKGEVEETFSDDFTHYPKEFFKAILRVKEEVLDKSEPVLDNIVYNKVFSEKTLAFLQTSDFKTKLSDYINKYNELIDASTYFKKGVFNHNNATTIAKNLKENGFFKANHSVSLNAKTGNRVIATEAELEEVIQQEKESILNNTELKKAFEEIDKKITANAELRDFRTYLENNQSILPELANIGGLKEKLWISYLKKNVEAYKALELEYSNGKKGIEDIVEQAKKEETEWRKVIAEFNKRFSVPFKLSVDNQDDVILKSEGPNIKFEFTDPDGSCPIEERKLLDVLSNGELRALYLLNIIFEVEARKANNYETIFIIDDIADSFDYKNKYAIIQYLKDISEESFFKQIILTHNFDFHRTVSSRLDMTREHKLNTVKTSDHIELVSEVYQNNPFLHWKAKLQTNNSMLIASIPFVRNLAEYSGHTEDFNKLTSLLHFKEATNDIKIADLETIIKTILIDKNALSLADANKPVIDLIFETASSIIASTAQVIELEDKVVLAIAIRLKAEQFIVGKINDDAFWKSITSNQTYELIKRYKTDFPAELETIDCLEQVNLMTPENIHLNSFMYEPILDMSNEHLKKLYVCVTELV